MKLLLKILPLSIATTCIVFLVLAIVPGRLEGHTSNLLLSLFIFLTGVVLYAGVLFLAIGEIYQQIFQKQEYKTLPKMAGIICLSMLIGTHLLLHYDIPAKLYFHTSIDRFQQIVNTGKYRDIKEVGNFKIADVVNNSSVDKENKSVYFVTRNVSNIIDIDRYGFAYLPDPSKTFATNISHIQGDWYIFCQRG